MCVTDTDVERQTVGDIVNEGVPDNVPKFEAGGVGKDVADCDIVTDFVYEGVFDTDKVKGCVVGIADLETVIITDIV